jgi:hypothetical protein
MSNVSCRGNVLNYSDAIQTGRARYERKMQAWPQIANISFLRRSCGQRIPPISWQRTDDRSRSPISSPLRSANQGLAEWPCVTHPSHLPSRYGVYTTRLEPAPPAGVTVTSQSWVVRKLQTEKGYNTALKIKLIPLLGGRNADHLATLYQLQRVFVVELYMTCTHSTGRCGRMEKYLVLTRNRTPVIQSEACRHRDLATSAHNQTTRKEPNAFNIPDNTVNH